LDDEPGEQAISQKNELRLGIHHELFATINKGFGRMTGLKASSLQPNLKMGPSV
jgi:hypothetical protein